MSSKDDLRQMMRKGMADRKTKVDSPYAKYTASGQLQCSLCNAPIKTEALWPVHLKSKTHKERQAQLEQPKKAPSKPAPSSSSSSSSSTSSSSSKASSDKRERTDDKDLMPPPPAKKTKETPAGLPAGFFDQYGDDDEEETKEEETKNAQPIVEEVEEEAPAPAAKSSLPAGFFDDPTMDAQMRGAKTPAKLKEEAIDKMYEKYQETISETLKNSDKIEVESLLKDESIDEEGDSEIVDREQEKREREERLAELRKKSDRVKELRQKLSTINKPKVVEVDDDDLVS